MKFDIFFPLLNILKSDWIPSEIKNKTTIILIWVFLSDADRVTLKKVRREMREKQLSIELSASFR